MPDADADADADEATATCPLCGYDLRGQRGQAEPRCPECGRRFEWADFDPERRRHPYLFEHHPERPVWSYFRTLIGGLRPRRFWSSINPAGPSNPRRFVAYWLIAATLWTAVALVGPVVAGVAEWHWSTTNYGSGYTPAWWQALPADQRAHLTSMYGSLQGFRDAIYPTSITWKLTSDYAWNRELRPSSWQFFLSIGRPSDNLAALSVPAWLVVLSWPWASLLSLLGLRASCRLARIRTVALLRTAAYAGDLLAWMAIGSTIIFGAVVYSAAAANPMVTGVPPTGLALWLPHAPQAARYLPAALALCWLVFAYRLYAAHRHYLRLPHALGVVVATQAILLLILANLYVLTLN